MTYEILLIVVIGGMGSVTGSVLTSFLFIAASEWWLRFLDNEVVIGGVALPFMRGSRKHNVDSAKARWRRMPPVSANHYGVET